MGHNCHFYLSFKLIPLKLSFTTAVYMHFRCRIFDKMWRGDTLAEQRTSSNQQNWCLITSKSFQWDWTEIERYNYVACFWHTWEQMLLSIDICQIVSSWVAVSRGRKNIENCCCGRFPVGSQLVTEASIKYQSFLTVSTQLLLIETLTMDNWCRPLRWIV